MPGGSSLYYASGITVVGGYECLMIHGNYGIRTEKSSIESGISIQDTIPQSNLIYNWDSTNTYSRRKKSLFKCDKEIKSTDKRKREEKVDHQVAEKMVGE